ncbi:L-lactate permease [Egicoccus halophilus]|uniref:L-lactate permease n=1 Tax=Egicoccus halophilus TaxID=1670830 RepID=A0A8J3A914_9ACTN|nr:L-lactate permease [Egicoccus halophilus]GGI07049.1 lactate transporter LctP family protein [Egicoccus halophilus]
MAALLAGIPILVVLVLMVGRRWAASRAGLVGAALALLIAVTAFDFGRGTPADAPGAGAFVGTFSEALFTSATILWIVIPALAIHHLQVGTGATDTLRRALGGLAADPRLFALLIGWFFALFVEGAAGFGASVALAAPFLVGVGYRALDAVLVAMLGHAIGVSFGAIGTPIVPQTAATGLPGLEIAGATAQLHLLAGWVLLVVMMVVASKAVGQPARGAIWGWTALAGAAFLVPYWAIATYVGPELPTLGGSLIGIAVFVAALKLAGRRRVRTNDASVVPPPVASPAPPIERPRRGDHEAPELAPERPGGTATVENAPGAGELLRAAAPYLALIVLVLLTRLVPPIRDPLRAIELAWSLPGGFTGSFRPLAHPGTLLALSFVGAALLTRAAPVAVRGALRTTFAQLGGVTVALVAMLSLARTMVHGGMTQSLAEAAAAAAGGAWPVLAPFVGVLGTFVTGSATASNVLFTDLQAATAEALELPLTPMVAAQGYGSAVGNIVCPHNIVAAGATVGLTGAEGDVLRRTMAPALGYALVGGFLLLLFFV